MLRSLISAAALATTALLAALPSAGPANGGLDRPARSDNPAQAEHGGSGDAGSNRDDVRDKRGVVASARGKGDAWHSGFMRRADHCSASSTDTLLGAVAGGLVARPSDGTGGLAPRAIEQTGSRC